MPSSASQTSYRLGSLYAVVTAVLMATQEPFSFLAASRLTTLQFVFLTQVALMVSIPLVTLPRRASRRDFVALLGNVSNYGKLAVLFAIGLVGLLLYNYGLGKANPVIISAVVNLSPFWAALVALLIAKVPIPVSPAVFFGCFLGAFVGAMVVAWSQNGGTGKPAASVLHDFLQGGWVYAIPVPIGTALGATLIGKWFAKYQESAAVAANFFVAGVILIPATLFMMNSRSELRFWDHPAAIVLMIVGTILAGSVGRVLYQVALRITGGDNGFVSMFFNLVPALTAFISLAMSFWLAALHFVVDPLFFIGLALIVASLLLFSLRAWRQPERVPSALRPRTTARRKKVRTKGWTDRSRCLPAAFVLGLSRPCSRGARGASNATSMQNSAPPNYRLGSFLSLVTAFLLATQEPFSFLAAKRLTTMQFVCLTQIALLISIPLVTFRPSSRRDFVALLADGSNYGKLAVVFAIGMTGLLLYNFGLSDAHPIIVSAILNLTPFWAGMVALSISRVPFPVSPAVFFACFLGAFVGAMAVAWSQLDVSGRPTIGQLADNFLHGSWIYIIPVPICSALGGTLIGRWFGKYEEFAAVAANFFVANVVLIPTTVLILYRRSELQFDAQFVAVALMIVGTIIAASVGRIFYQITLTVTGGDNGFVTMFWNLVPALTALVSLAMSFWIADLHFAVDPMYFLGLGLIAASLMVFSLKSWRMPPRAA